MSDPQPRDSLDDEVTPAGVAGAADATSRGINVFGIVFLDKRMADTARTTLRASFVMAVREVELTSRTCSAVTHHPLRRPARRSFS